MKVAEIGQEDIDSINHCQSNIKTRNNKGIVLIAYEKE